MIYRDFFLSQTTLWSIIIVLVLLIALILFWLLRSKNLFTIIKIKNQTRKNKKRNFIQIQKSPKNSDTNIRSIQSIFSEKNTHDKDIFSSTLFLKMHSFLLHCTSKNDFIKSSIHHFCYFCPGQSAILYWDENNDEILHKKMHFSLKNPQQKHFSIAYEDNIMLRYGKESALLEKKSHYVMNIEKNTYLCLPLFFLDKKEGKVNGILKLSLQTNNEKPYSDAEIKKKATFFTRLAFFYSLMLSHYYLFHKNILYNAFFSVDYFVHLVETLQKINHSIAKNISSWTLVGVQLHISHSKNKEVPLSSIKMVGEKMSRDDNTSFRFCLFSQEKSSVTLFAIMRQNKKSSFSPTHTQEKINQYLVDADITTHFGLSKSIKFIDFEKLSQIVLKQKKTVVN